MLDGNLCVGHSKCPEQLPPTAQAAARRRVRAAQGGCTRAGQSPNSPGKLQLARRAGRAGVGALSAPSVQRGLWARTTAAASSPLRRGRAGRCPLAAPAPLSGGEGCLAPVLSDSGGGWCQRGLGQPARLGTVRPGSYDPAPFWAIYNCCTKTLLQSLYSIYLLQLYFLKKNNRFLVSKYSPGHQVSAQ